MKKILFSIAVVLVAGVSVFSIINHKDEKLTKVKLAEVAHSIFYAPQYAAHSLGYFKDEGLDVEILLVPGADKVAAAVLSGDVNIGFCGTEATIYIYNQGEKDYLQVFAGLTKRDGGFIVSRKPMDKFKLEDLKGSYVIGGRKGGMPEMSLEWVLKQAGIDPQKDLTIDTSVAFPAMAGAFIGGLGDYVDLFEPQAIQVERQGFGYVVASLGAMAGEVPYTAYNAKKSYIEANPDIIQKFTNAMQKGLDFVHKSTPEEIANVILTYFPDTSKNDLISIVKRYKDNDSWYATTYIDEASFKHVQEIMKSAGQLNEEIPYDKLIITKKVTK